MILGVGLAYDSSKTSLITMRCPPLKVMPSTRYSRDTRHTQRHTLIYVINPQNFRDEMSHPSGTTHWHASFKIPMSSFAGFYTDQISEHNMSIPMTVMCGFSTYHYLHLTELKVDHSYFFFYQQTFTLFILHIWFTFSLNKHFFFISSFSQRFIFSSSCWHEHTHGNSYRKISWLDMLGF